MKQVFSNCLTLTLLVFLFSCQEEKVRSSKELVICVKADAESLFPLYVQSNFDNYLLSALYQTLISIDYNSGEVMGVLAEERPVYTKLDSGKGKYSYRLRKGIRFNDGSPLDANDVAFSLKLNICPAINTTGAAAYYAFIDTIITNPNDPQEFSIICNNQYFRNEYLSGDWFVLPKQQYDSNNVLSSFSLNQLRDDSILLNNPNLLAYTEEILRFKNNSEEIKFIGSGPYQLGNWVKDQSIRLSKVENWWGNELNLNSSYFDQESDQIKFIVLEDELNASTAFKAGKIDLMVSIDPKLFLQLKEDKENQCLLAEKNNYEYIGFNHDDPLLANPLMRKAIYHLIDRELIINQVLYGLANPTNGPLSPSRKLEYNSEINAPDFNPDSCMHLLSSMGWSDSDANGILDFSINGEHKELELDYIYNAGNEIRNKVGLLLKDQAEKIGIKINVIPLEWSQYLERMIKGETQLFYHAVGSANIPQDFGSSFHSSSAENGRNVLNYRSSKADSIIMEMKNPILDQERNKLTHQFQEILMQDYAAIYLYSTMERLVYSDRVESPSVSNVRPHYWAPSIRIK